MTRVTIHAHSHGEARLPYERIRRPSDEQMTAAEALVDEGGPVLDRIGRIIRLWLDHDPGDAGPFAIVQGPCLALEPFRSTPSRGRWSKRLKIKSLERVRAVFLDYEKIERALAGGDGGRTGKQRPGVRREGTDDGELREDTDTDTDTERLTQIIFAARTLGLRPAVFEDRSPRDRADEIDPRIGVILGSAP